MANTPKVHGHVKQENFEEISMAGMRQSIKEWKK